MSAYKNKKIDKKITTGYSYVIIKIIKEDEQTIIVYKNRDSVVEK